MLVVRHTRADGGTPLHEMPSMGEREKEVDRGARKTGHYLASPIGKEMASRFVSK